MAGIAPQPQDDQAQPDPTQQAPDQQQAPDDSQPQQGPDEVGDEEGLSPNVSPEEQKQYEDFVLSGMAIIYQRSPDGKQGQVRPGILKLLDNDPSDLRGILGAKEMQQFSPLVAIAATAVIITVQIQKLAAEEKPTDDVVMHGGAAILEELAEVWMRRNHQQLGEDDLHKALSMAMDIYREVAADAGLINEGALKDEFQRLVQADKQGKLADISPDLAGINQAAQINMKGELDEQHQRDQLLMDRELALRAVDKQDKLEEIAATGAETRRTDLLAGIVADRRAQSKDARDLQHDIIIKKIDLKNSTTLAKLQARIGLDKDAFDAKIANAKTVFDNNNTVDRVVFSSDGQMQQVMKNGNVVSKGPTGAYNPSGTSTDDLGDYLNTGGDVSGSSISGGTGRTAAQPTPKLASQGSILSQLAKAPPPPDGRVGRTMTGPGGAVATWNGKTWVLNDVGPSGGR
jgi:hypothetical protein